MCFPRFVPVADICNAIVPGRLAFGVLGKATDALLAGAVAPFLTWEDRVRSQQRTGANASLRSYARAPSSFMSSSATKRDSSSCSPASGTWFSVWRSKPAP